MSRSLGIPVKLLHEASGHIVTVELKSGELYRGSMLECEDNWNCQLENITYTAKVPLLFPLFSTLFFCSYNLATVVFTSGLKG
ncbi:Small nuclear ribonucleoprotein SmD3b [Linum perenne]